MKKRAFASMILAWSVTLSAQAASLADRVFAKAKGSPAMLQALSPADRQAIVSLLPLAIGPGGSIVDNTDCRQEAGPELTVVDLRRDGQPAVFTVTGNACTSGGTGASLYLVAKVSGQWRRHFDVPAIEYRLLRSQANGWPEIGLLGQSKCTGVWQYDGREYKHVRNIDDRGNPCKE